MRIVIVSRRLNHDQSAPKCSLYLASSLADLGHEIHVVTSVASSQGQEKLRKAGAIIHETSEFFARKDLSPFLYTQFAKRLKKKLSADMILGNGYTLFDDVTWVHLPRLANMARLGSKSRSLYFEAILEKLLFSTSKSLLAPSSIVAEDLIRLYGAASTKIIVQPHGVDTEYYIPIAKGEKIKLRTKDEVCLLFVGGDPLRKGFHLLLKSLARIKDLRNLKLLAVGFNPSSNIYALVEKLGLKRMVAFKGFVKTDELRHLYQHSDFYVLPSLYDPFSIATLEAMATSLPTVVSHYTGICDILHNWRDAIIVDPLNIADFAKALSLLTQDAKLREKIGMNARLTAEKYSWENVAKDLSENFKNISTGK